MTIGERIRRARENCGISQTALAEKIGVYKQTLYKYEKGIITNIPSDKIALIADACDCTPAYLMGWTEDPEDHGEPASTLQPYYFDPETAAIAQEIHDNRQMQILFDAARDATPEQLRAVQALIRGFKEDAEGGRDDGNQRGWTE